MSYVAMRTLSMAFGLTRHPIAPDLAPKAKVTRLALDTTLQIHGAVENRANQKMIKVREKQLEVERKMAVVPPSVRDLSGRKTGICTGHQVTT